ncbi:YdeI/OmpD-associated family protein [Umezawaea endophytica]|uniref:YdeI/OmpD-associated family protein n=1 Tax=Umezawaea endophytica TaxID=1654476 RepID=A0A9X3A361_9PSEU|nr:YdeI/OmpD-associated family protein [Umezawaea endophytica]MCS7481379.1 YdeI/OmpD-associated family protein [Umezawaea endophytica]
MNFRATVLLSGKTATGVQVPDEVVTALDSGKRPAVKVRINDYTYRSSIASMSGVFMLPISAEVRAGAKIAAGDSIEVTVELDTEPREVEVPEDLAAAMTPETRTRFDALSYSAKRRLTIPINDAKTPETRQRRITKTIETLNT